MPRRAAPTRPGASRRNARKRARPSRSGRTVVQPSGFLVGGAMRDPNDTSLGCIWGATRSEVDALARLAIRVPSGTRTVVAQQLTKQHARGPSSGDLLIKSPLLYQLSYRVGDHKVHTSQPLIQLSAFRLAGSLRPRSSRLVTQAHGAQLGRVKAIFSELGAWMSNSPLPSNAEP